LRWSDGEVGDGVVVALLGVGQGEAGVDLQGLAGGVATVGLDERVVDALGLTGRERFTNHAEWVSETTDR
jgi:hypothetical protein